MRLRHDVPLIALAAWCAFCPVRALAQETPEETAAAYYGAIGDGDWSRVTALTHPHALAQLRALIIGAVEELGDTAAPGNFNPIATRTDALALLDVDSLAQLKRLAPTEAYERFLSGDGFVRSVLTQIENESESDLLGYVSEGDSLVHLVRRVRFTGARPDRLPKKVEEREEVSRMDVITLKRDGAAWRVVTETGFSMSRMIRSGLSK